MPNTPDLGISHWTPNQLNPDVTGNTAIDSLDLASAGSASIDCTAGGSIATTALAADGFVNWLHARLKLTGTPAAGFNLIVPLTNPKLYIIDNQSGQTATVKGSTGTGIAVLTGGVQIVYCDGTNVLAVTAETSGGSITLGGDVTGPASANTAAKINGTSVPAGPAAPQALVATGAAAASWQNLPVDVPVFLKSKPAASDYVTYALAHAINFLANFAAGSGATVNIAAAVAALGTLPTGASWVVTINDLPISGGTLGAATAIGTVTITSAGVVTFATTGGTAKTVAAGHALQFSFPVAQDATAADFSCTLGGYR